MERNSWMVVNQLFVRNTPTILEYSLFDYRLDWRFWSGYI
jgi:hypothetical protein